MKRIFTRASLMMLSLMLGLAAYGQTYCTTGLYGSSCTSGDYIQSFSTTGGTTNITNNNTGCSNTASNYTYFSTMTHSAIQGTVVNFSFTNNPTWQQGYKIWVDYNNNGSFADPGDQVYASAGTVAGGSTVTGSFTVPITAIPGTLRMRIRCVYFTTTFTSCDNQTFGEVEDYNLQVIAATPCSGMPTAGTASLTSTCPTTVSLAGFTLEGNIVFQWQKRTACDTTWTDIPGATSYNYSIISQPLPTDYRAIVTCTNTSQSDISNVVTITSATPCYCSSTAQFPDYDEIANVTVGALNNPTGCGVTSPVPGSVTSLYNDYTNLPPLALIKGGSVPFSVQINECSVPFQGNGTAIFIDFNQNGSYTDIGERVFGNSATVFGANGVSGTFTVPTTAATGITGMRVITQSGTAGNSISSCGSYNYGETEDYLVNIMYAPDAAGGGVYCSGQTITLSATAPGINNPQFLWIGPNGFVDTNAVVTFPNAQTTINGTYNVYVLSYPCGSLGAPDTSGPRMVNVWVNQTPPEPSMASVITYCQNAPFDSIYYYGFNLKWYDSATGGSYTTTAPVINTGVIGSDTFYVSQTVSGCEGPRKQVIVHVVPAVSAPAVVSPVLYCEGDQAAPLIANGQNIRWYSVPTGGAGTPLTPVPTTNAQGVFTWYASQTINGCESERAAVEVHVNYKPAGLVLAPREYVCQYDTMTLIYFGNADASAQYTWTFDVGNTVVSGSPASQGPLLVRFDSAGVSRIRLQINNDGCVGPETFVDVPVRLSPLVKIDLQPDACKGETVTLAVGYSTPGIDHYTWNFAGGNIIYGSFSGGPYGIRWDNPGSKVLTVVANDGVCKSLVEMDTIMVHDAPNAQIINVSKTDICTGDSVTLQAAAGEGNSYQWLPAEFFGERHDAVQTGIIDFTTHVVVNVTSEFNCKASDSVLITTHPCCEIFMPNAFTPNNDQHNDKFHIIHQGHHELRNFRIQNRWGAMVFETQDEYAGWDGTYNNIPQDMGTYFYYVRYKCSDGQIYEKKGELLLMR